MIRSQMICTLNFFQALIFQSSTDFMLSESWRVNLSLVYRVEVFSRGDWLFGMFIQIESIGNNRRKEDCSVKRKQILELEKQDGCQAQCEEAQSAGRLYLRSEYRRIQEQVWIPDSKQFTVRAQNEDCRHQEGVSGLFSCCAACVVLG